MRTQVAIVGAGPAGLLLSHLLHLEGIDSVVLEARSREYVEKRVRAGVLEHATVELLREAGLGQRLDREGMPHHGLSLRFDRVDHRIALTDLTGRHITIYGQQEVVKDLIAARLAAGGQLLFEVSDVRADDVTTDSPRVTFVDATGSRQVLECDAVAGCDGSHGVTRAAIPDDAIRMCRREYPFAWLGVLASTPPSSDELIYVHHERGFALHSMRSPELTRLYLQVPADEDLSHWPDDRIWEELDSRLETQRGFTLREGPLVDKSITPMRSFVAEPMRFGRLFLAGDAAHVVPATGAKGLNLAVADVVVLSRALTVLLRHNRTDLVESYSDTCLRRVWRAEYFSWWMTTMLHVFSDDPFHKRMQLAQLRYLVSSRAAVESFAENYAGFPFETRQK